MQRQQDGAGGFHRLAFERAGLVEGNAREKILVPPRCAVDYIVRMGYAIALSILCKGRCYVVDADKVNTLVQARAIYPGYQTYRAAQKSTSWHLLEYADQGRLEGS